MKKFAIIAACILSFGAHADDAWVRVAATKSGDAVVDVKKGSGKLVTTKSGQAYFVVVERFSHVSGKTSYGLTSVAVDDCARGFGTLRSYTFQGEAVSTNDFVIGGSTVADVVSATYCEIATAMQSRDM